MIGRTSHYLPKATSLFCAGGRPFFASFENRGYCKKCLGRVGDPRKYCACQQTFHKSRHNAGESAICEKFAGMRSTFEGSKTARGTFSKFLQHPRVSSKFAARELQNRSPDAPGSPRATSSQKLKKVPRAVWEPSKVLRMPANFSQIALSPAFWHDL